jgi:hypothetical protein
MKPNISDYLIRNIEDRVQALVPASLEDVAAWLDKAPVTREVLERFPEAREKVLAAVSMEPGDDYERSHALWDVLREFPEAEKALLAALKTEAGL